MSSPANAPTAKPSINASIAVPLSIATGGRSSTANRVRHCARPWRCARSAATASTRRARSDSMRQCNVTLTPALRSTITPGSRASASSAAAATAPRNGTTRGSTRRSPSTSDLHAVQAREHEPGHRNPLLRGTRPGGRSRSRPGRPGRPAPRSASIAAGSADRIVGKVDDRRQRAVVVDEDRRAGGPLDERIDHCVDVEHSGTLPVWTPRPRRVKPSVRTRPTLIGLSHRVHAHPELKFEETRSSAWTAGVLADAGLTVDAGICDLPTAFSCRIGTGSLHLAICAEYDALPGIGHACGHNIIAATAVGAGLALAPLVDDLDLCDQRDRHAGRGGRRRQGVPARARRVRRRRTPR